MKNFRTLELAIEFYELTKGVTVVGHMKDQLDRAASSIALNLSEGNAKGSPRDKINFFQTAYGSLRECQTLFRLLKVEDEEILKSADILGGYIYKLLNSKIKPAPWKL
jgi:four helix bundle protein